MSETSKKGVFKLLLSLLVLSDVVMQVTSQRGRQVYPWYCSVLRAAGRTSSLHPRCISNSCPLIPILLAGKRVVCVLGQATNIIFLFSGL